MEEVRMAAQMEDVFPSKDLQHSLFCTLLNVIFIKNCLCKSRISRQSTYFLGENNNDKNLLYFLFYFNTDFQGSSEIVHTVLIFCFQVFDYSGANFVKNNGQIILKSYIIPYNSKYVNLRLLSVGYLQFPTRLSNHSMEIYLPCFKWSPQRSIIRNKPKVA